MKIKKNTIITLEELSKKSLQLCFFIIEYTQEKNTRRRKWEKKRNTILNLLL